MHPYAWKLLASESTPFLSGSVAQAAESISSSMMFPTCEIFHGQSSSPCLAVGLCFESGAGAFPFPFSRSSACSRRVWRCSSSSS